MYIRAIVDFPRDSKGLFRDPGVYDAKFEVGEMKRRMSAVYHFQYADDLGCGSPHNFHVEGDYNCGDCNQFDEGTCLLLVEGEDVVDADAGSCEDWENENAADTETRLHHKTREMAAYGEALNGEGFGCWRCPFGRKASAPDSRGRDVWCGKHACRVKNTACCSINGAPLRKPGNAFATGGS